MSGRGRIPKVTGIRARRLPALILAAAAWALPQAAAEPPGAPKPAYCLAADWPKLPADLELGQAAGLGIDSRDVVYVFHRGERSWGTAPALVARAGALWAGLWAGLFGADPESARPSPRTRSWRSTRRPASCSPASAPAASVSLTA